MAENMAKGSIKKALDYSKSLSIVKYHVYLELLISRWSTQTHRFIAA